MISAIRFEVYEPVGKNAIYARGAGRRLYITDTAKAFIQRIAYAAVGARSRSDWPRDASIPKRVRVTCQLYNTRHDAGACATVIRDALEGILYANDRIVSNGAEELPMQDGGGRRVEVLVELLA